MEKSALKRSARHREGVTDHSVSETYKIHRGLLQRMIAELAEHAPLQTVRRSLTGKQAQNGLNFTSISLHVMQNTRATNDMKYLTNWTEYIKSCLCFKQLKRLDVFLHPPKESGNGCKGYAQAYISLDNGCPCNCIQNFQQFGNKLCIGSGFKKSIPVVIWHAKYSVSGQLLSWDTCLILYTPLHG